PEPLDRQHRGRSADQHRHPRPRPPPHGNGWPARLGRRTTMTSVATTPAANAKSDPVVRRRQADRTAAMRAALADAAADVLIERGWAATTVTEVCRRAGVTTGAFHHHYPNLPNLLADALRRLYATMGTKRTSPITDLVSLIDATWAAIGNPRFKA